MAQQKAAARAAWKGSGAKASDDVWFDIAERVGATDFIGYVAHEAEGEVVAILKDGFELIAPAAVNAPADIVVITNQTPFYGESGGQMGDAGYLARADGMRAVVTDTSKPLGRLHAHQVRLEKGTIAVGDSVHLAIDVARRDRLRANHSATHLLHAALRHRLGRHVTQKGSLVAPDRLRFDFSHPSALTPDDIAVIEAEVNAQIRGNRDVTTRLMTPDDAVAAGALALFGEKYGDEVRVLSMGTANEADYSVELCGGTHVEALGDIALFKIVGESAVSSGVRRIEALTGEAARLWLVERDARLRETAGLLKATPDEVPGRVASLVEERRRLERELAEAKKALAMGGGTGATSTGPDMINGLGFAAQVVEGFDPKGLRGAVDEMKARIGSGVAMLVAVNEGRASVAVGVSEDQVGTYNAVDLLRRAVAVLGGQGGGGRSDMAQGGGPDGSRADEAVDAVRTALEEASRPA